MIEVFKTNVDNAGRAHTLVQQIHRAFPGYKANFDLDDCDRILRIACINGVVNLAMLTGFLQRLGVHAEVLTDDISVSQPYHTLYMEN